MGVTDWKEAQGSLLDAGNVLFLDLNGGHSDVCVCVCACVPCVKINQAV